MCYRNDSEDIMYATLRGEDDADFATRDVDTGLPLAKHSSADYNMMITGIVSTQQDHLSLRCDSDAPCRPKYHVRDVRFGTSETKVTFHEQNTINLMSSFSPTYTTENGKTFVESLSAIVTAEELSKSYTSYTCGRYIMWPTHPPDNTEILNGVYGSTTNWKFAVIQELNVGGVTRATVMDTLYPVEIRSDARKKSVTFDTPSRFLIPKGHYRRTIHARYFPQRVVQIVFFIYLLFFFLFIVCRILGIVQDK